MRIHSVQSTSWWLQMKSQEITRVNKTHVLWQISKDTSTSVAWVKSIWPQRLHVDRVGWCWQSVVRRKMFPSELRFQSGVSASALTCNADRMCQQVKPNETHLSSGLDRGWSAVSIVSALGHADRTSSPNCRPLVSSGRSRGHFWVVKQSEWSAYPSECLTQGATGKSDKMSQRLSDSDVLIERPVRCCSSGTMRWDQVMSFYSLSWLKSALDE